MSETNRPLSRSPNTLATQPDAPNPFAKRPEGEFAPPSLYCRVLLNGICYGMFLTPQWAWLMVERMPGCKVEIEHEGVWNWRKCGRETFLHEVAIIATEQRVAWLERASEAGDPKNYIKPLTEGRKRLEVMRGK